MSEHPILFSSAMVKAILEGRKTQTRRVVSPPAWVLPDPIKDQWGNYFWLHDDTRPDEEHLYAKTWPKSKAPIGSNPGPCCPYGQPGDELWVRETWCCGDREPCDCLPGACLCRPSIHYRSDWAGIDDDVHWSPPRCMPRWASRIQLVIRDVRVQRLQEIGREDVRAEGIPENYGEHGRFVQERFPKLEPHEWDNARWDEQWAMCWDSINAKRAPWSSNPWVWAITFDRKEKEST